MTQVQLSLIEATKELLTAIKRNYLLISANVYQMHEAWTGSPDEWCDFYEQELELSKSQVSKMRQVGEFVLAHGLLQETVGYEALYKSIARHKGQDVEPRLILAEAQVWSNDDYKSQAKEDCKEHQWATYCGLCWKKQQ